jgi:hypothetical protein
MAAIVNRIDTTLQAAATRTTLAPSAALVLVPSVNSFLLDAGGTPQVAAITFTAAKINVDGVISFTCTGGTVTVNGNVATLAYANMTASSAVVTATITVNGSPVSASATVIKFTDPAVAKAAADNASTQAALANTALTQIASDSILSPGEKPEANAKWNAIYNEYTAYYTQGTTYSQTTQRDAYATAYSNLNTYITGLGTEFTNIPGNNIAINGATFRSTFQAYYDARQTLLNAITVEVGKRAAWSSVANRPANIAALTGTEAIQNSLITLTGLGQTNYRARARGGLTSATYSSQMWKDGAAYGAVDQIPAGEQRSYSVYVFNRSDGSLAGARWYDVYGNAANATSMAQYLNQLGPNYVVVVITYDEPKTNRLAGGLDAAMYRCGASRAVYGSSQFMYRSAYILVGVPGCGEGNGAEAYQGAADGDTNAWCDVGFNILNGALTGVSGSYQPKSLQDYGYTGDLNATTAVSLVGRSVTVQGSTLSKNGGTSGQWDADAYSKQSYPCAYATATSSGICDIFFGINADPLYDASFGSIDFAWYLRGDGLAFFYTGGYNQGNTNYTAGDTFTVSYDGVYARWLKNGVAAFTLRVNPPQGPLYFDSSFAYQGQPLLGVQFGPMANVYQAPRGDATTPDNVFPDPRFKDLVWWNMLGLVNIGDWQDISTSWRTAASCYLPPSTYRTIHTGWFPMTPGATYRTTLQVSKPSDLNAYASFFLEFGDGTVCYFGQPQAGVWGGSSPDYPGVQINYYPGSQNGFIDWVNSHTVNNDTRANKARFVIIQNNTAGTIEFGGITLTRMADAALVAPGAVTNSSLALTAATISGLPGYVGGGSGRPAITVADIYLSGSGGKAPYTFDYNLEITTQQTPTVTLLLDSTNNAHVKIKGFQIGSDGTTTSGNLKVAMTDGNGLTTYGICAFDVS